MKCRSTIPGFSTAFCRRMVSWCCKQLELPAREVSEAMFRRSRSAWGGLCHGRRIGVRINPNWHWPATYRIPGTGVRHQYADATEALVKVTAHELCHVLHLVRRDGSRRGGSWGGSEHKTDWHAERILRAFRDNRAALLGDWDGPESRRPATRSVSLIDRRAAKAANQLAAWQRKAKLAATKIKKYKRQVRYYEKKIGTAAAPTEGSAE